MLTLLHVPRYGVHVYIIVSIGVYVYACDRNFDCVSHCVTPL